MSGTAVWTAPPELALGRLGTLELRRESPSQPPLPRPGDDRLGPLAVRAVEPLPDGAGWRLTVQPLAVGSFAVPPLDLGEGWSTRELRVTVPRTVPFGAPWMGVGGAGADRLPPVPFPWPWALPLALPLALLAAVLVRRHRRGARRRRLRSARRAFARAWPPAAADRSTLDGVHQAGRALLAAIYGTEALSWGASVLQARGLGPWAAWLRTLDRARFGGRALDRPPTAPPLADLLACLELR
jgi:hypothetical protein